MLANYLARYARGRPIRYALDPQALNLEHLPGMDPRSRSFSLWANAILHALAARPFGQGVYGLNRTHPEGVEGPDAARRMVGLAARHTAPQGPVARAVAAGSPGGLANPTAALTQMLARMGINPGQMREDAHPAWPMVLRARGEIDPRAHQWPEHHPLVQAFLGGTPHAQAGDQAALSFMWDPPHYEHGHGIAGHWGTGHPTVSGHQFDHYHEAMRSLHLIDPQLPLALMPLLRRGIYQGGLEDLVGASRLLNAHVGHPALVGRRVGNYSPRGMTLAEYAATPDADQGLPARIALERILEHLQPPIRANVNARLASADRQLAGSGGEDYYAG